MNTFLSTPSQLEDKIKQWQAADVKNISIDKVVSYTGHHVYAITFTESSISREYKKAHYFAQPHAHEPGATAGMMDVLEQLITGKDVFGNPTELDVEKVAATTVLTFNPIGNPYGRERAPVACWDGSQFTNEEFWCQIFGEDPENPGKMWKRLGIWSSKEMKAPDPVGIVYEPIDEFTYVEPNRSQYSSYFKLFHMMNSRYAYDAWLDMHQTEFVGRNHQCEILLPLAEAVSSKNAAENKAWADLITRKWSQAGFITAEPKQIPYKGEQAQYFLDNWGQIYHTINCINTEVKNNALDFPAEKQLKAQSIAIVSSIQRITGERYATS